MPPFLIRMFFWVRNPPSRNQQIAIALVCGTGIVLAAVEYVFGWPEWLSAERVPRGPRIGAP
jgi:hypothetical protein